MITPTGGSPAKLADQIGALQANQVSGRATYTTWSILSGVSGSAGQGAEVIPADTGTHTDPVVGGTVANAGLYVWSASPAGWKWVGSGLGSKADQTFVSDQAAIRGRSMSFSGATGALQVANSLSLDALWTTALGDKGWAVALDAGTDVTVGDYLDGFALDVTLSTTATRVILNVYSRDASDANANGLPGQATDTLLMTIDNTLAQAGLTAADSPHTAVFQFPKYLVIEAGKAYVFAFEARDGSNALVVSGCGQHTSSGFSQRRRGYFRNSGGTWANISNSTLGIAWKAMRAPVANAAADSANARKAALIMVAKTQQKFARIGAPLFSKALGFSDWIAGIVEGVDIVAGTKFDTATIAIDPDATAVTAIFKLWRRGTASTGFPVVAGDVLVETAIYTISQLGLVSGSYNDAVVSFGTPVQVQSGDVFLFEVDLYDSSGVRKPYGVKGVTDASITQANRRGYYRNAVPSPATVNSGLSLSVSLGLRVLAAPDPVSIDFSPFDAVVACSATTSALTATIDSALSTLDRRGTELAFGMSVSFTAPTSGSVTDEAVTISFIDKAYGSGALGSLANANISSVVVKDAGTLAVLVENTDYVVNYQHGKIVRAASGIDRAVLVSYSWSRRRYDMIVLNPETLALSVIAGTEANRDAQERLAVRNAADQIPLFGARVISSAVTLVPLWDADNARPRKYLTGLNKDLQRSRRHLRPILKKLQDGSAVTFAGYGDSIIGCPGSSASATVPNGTLRDITSMFSGPTGSDLVSALPLYDQGDGGGAIHHHASHIRRAIDALANRYSSAITYLNFGIAGTTSASTTNNGQDATRLGALTASAADIVIIGFGMNELGAATTAANVTAIAQACLTAGKCVLIIGVPRPNAIRNTSADANWRYTNRALARVARYLDVAFVDFMSLYDDDCLAALGISPLDVCASNYYNHPSLNEYTLMGAVITRLFVDGE
jgi:hypothetical protein